MLRYVYSFEKDTLVTVSDIKLPEHLSSWTQFHNQIEVLNDVIRDVNAEFGENFHIILYSGKQSVGYCNCHSNQNVARALLENICLEKNDVTLQFTYRSK